MTIPCLNYSNFCSGSQEQKENFAHALVESFEQTGFCKLECHGFELEQLSEMFDWVCSHWPVKFNIADDLQGQSVFRPAT
jgi:isopenicillin N synthase-like dioxygenase